MYINKTNGASYNYKAPNISDDANSKVVAIFPTFESQEVTLVSNAATATIKRTETLIDLGDTALTANATLTLTPDTNLPAGAKVRVKFAESGNIKTVTVKKDADDDGVTLNGMTSRTICRTVMWSGTEWIQFN